MAEVTEDTISGLNPIAVIDSVAPDGWKKKIGKVAAQLGIGTRKGAQLYAAGKDQIDTSEGKSIVSKALAEAVAREAVDNPVMMERARARFLSEFGAKQENLEAVMIAAAGHLNSGPPPAPLLLVHGDQPTPSAGADEAPAEDDAAPLQEDWAQRSRAKLKVLPPTSFEIVSLGFSPEKSGHPVHTRAEFYG